MKTFYTYSFFRTLFITFAATIFTLNLAGQTSHPVAVTDYQFTPKNLTINAGDKVVWTDTGAMQHNVNGTTATYSNNPVSFGNDLGIGWTYEFTFTTAGTYDYRCDLHFAFGMVGTVTVNPATGTQDLAGKITSIQLYPNPASQYVELLVPANYDNISSLKVYSIAGTLIDQKTVSRNVESFRYDLSGFKNGIYLMEINSGAHKDILKFLKY